jgi:putative transposase
MILSEKHIIKKNKELDELTFNCKNLYNKANYIIRQEFIENGHYFSKFDMFNIMKNMEEYQKMPVRVSRGVLRTLDANWKSFFSCVKKWKENKTKFTGKPSLPKYLPKNGKFSAIFVRDAVLKPSKKQVNTVGLSGMSLRIETRIPYDEIIEIQINPLINGEYSINIIHNHNESPLKNNNNYYCGIDLGVNNLMTVTSNKKGLQPILVNGRTLKSINQYYNKKKAKLQSELPKNTYTSKRIKKLTIKRNRKMEDYLHKSANYVIKFCLNNNINTLIVGYNEFWKQNVNMGKVNNQMFASIPYDKLVKYLEYKCQKYGINFIKNEESYTSKCSFLDCESVERHDKYVGKRIKRGLFKTAKGCLVNADVNGSLNIIKKAIPKAFDVDGIEGLTTNPKRVISFKR